MNRAVKDLRRLVKQAARSKDPNVVSEMVVKLRELKRLTIDFNKQFEAECQPDPLWSEDFGLTQAHKPEQDDWWRDDPPPLHNELDFMFEHRPRREWDGRLSQRQEWARKVRKRDGYRCQECGGLGEVAHHIIPVSKDPDRALDMSNGKTLCNTCHLEVHRRRQAAVGGTGSPWLY